MVRPISNVCSLHAGGTPDQRGTQRRASLEPGLTHRQISHETGIPLGTIRKWARGLVPKNSSDLPSCPRCGAAPHNFPALPFTTYSYLLGIHLGDGHLVHQRGRSYSMRVALDSKCPKIVSEVCDAIALIRGRRPWSARDRYKHFIRIVSYWKQWPCLFPQHGPGRKHSRPIVLTDWQWTIVRSEPAPFLRALIQTDGWRGLNRVHVKGRDYAYPRYQFSNRSDDIRSLFTRVCDLIGVDWRPWGRWHISVARRESVARLDEFIGPKG
jgi:hypothetical protein